MNQHLGLLVGSNSYWHSKDYGLKIIPEQKIDRRRDLQKSTSAAAGLLKKLIVRWNGDLKMALASYNQGEARIRKICRSRIETTESGNCDVSAQNQIFEEMADLLEISNNSFWILYRANVLSLETQNYIMRFLGGNIVALAPQSYGFDTPPLILD